MKKLLVLTDFSREAEEASRYAINMAHNNQLAVCFTHCLKSSHGPLPAFDEKTVLRKLDRWEEEARNKGVTAKLHLMPELIIAEVLGLIEKEQFEVVVMGLHPKESLFTKTLSEVSPIPVLMIRENTEFFDYTEIIMASEGKGEMPSFLRSL